MDIPTFGLGNHCFRFSLTFSIVLSTIITARVRAALEPQATAEYMPNLSEADPLFGTLALMKVQHKSKLIMVIQKNMDMVRKYPQ